MLRAKLLDTEAIGSAHGEGRVEEALDYLQQELRILENEPDPAPLETATTLHSIGWVLLKTGELDRATPYIERALATDESSILSSQLTALLGWCYLAEEGYARALSTCEMASTMADRATLPFYRVDVGQIDSQLCMGRARVEVGEATRAIEPLALALRACERDALMVFDRTPQQRHAERFVAHL